MKRIWLLPAVLIMVLALLPVEGSAQSREEAMRLYNEAEKLDASPQTNNDLVRAAHKYEQAMKIFDQLGDKSGVEICANNAGIIYANWGEYNKAVEYFEKSLAIKREHQDRRGEGQTLGNVGLVYMYWGQYPKAVECLEKSLAIAREFKDRKPEANALNNLGNVYTNLGQYEKAAEYFEKSLAIKRELQDRRGEGQTLNSLGAVYTNRGQYEKAVEYYEESLAIKKEFADIQGEGTAFNNLGVVYSHWGQYDKAAEYFEKSLAIKREFKDRRGEGQTLNNLGNIYKDWGQYEKAIEYYERSLAIKRELEDEHGEGMTLNNLGNVYSDWGRYEKAAEYYEKSLAICRELKDRHTEGQTLNNQGIVYKNWGQYKKAVENYEKSLVIYREVKDRHGEGTTLNNLGNVYSDWGQYDRAVENYEKSLAIYREVKDRHGEGATLNNLGIVYSDWGQYERAVENYEKSLAIYRELKDVRGEGQTLNNLGNVYSDWGQYEKAVEYYRKSRATCRELKDMRGEANSLGNLGNVYSDWGQHDKSVAYYEKSLALSRELKDRRGEGLALMNVGQVLQHRGEHTRALDHFNRGLAIWTAIKVPTRWPKSLIADVYMDRSDLARAEPLLKEANYDSDWGRFYLLKADFLTAKQHYESLLTSAEKNRNADNLFTAYTGLGAAYEGAEDDSKALEYYDKAVRLTENLRSSLSQREREKFFDVRINGFFRTAPYEGLARVLTRMGKQDQAFTTTEFTKARVFAEGMSSRQGKQSYDVPQDVKKKDAQFLNQLAALKKQLRKAYEKNNTLSIQSFEPQIERLEKEFASHKKMLREKYPLFAATRYPEPMELSHTAVRDDEWVLSYDVTDSGILIYLTKGKNLVKSVFKPVPRKEVDDLVRRFRAPLELTADDDLFEKLKAFDFGSGKKVSELLLGDILTDLPKGAPVIVIPDDSLGVLPFEMLVLNSGGKVATHKRVPCTTGAEFFGDRNPISYCQSVTALSLARTFGKQKNTAKKVLCMDDPVFSPDDDRLTKMTKGNKLELMGSLSEKLMSIKAELGVTFPRLPRTGDLGKSLETLEPASTERYTEFKACKPVLFEKNLENYGYMVFATHGYFGKDLPGIQEPVLVLTLVDQPRDQDGFLRLYEVMGLKLNADMVALTACQTGLGRRISGEGTMGMGRAFQYAGAKSVLMSLWSVSEESSVQLVESFFKHLKEGKNKLDSIRLAKQEIRQAGFDHPFFWAPFILVGEAR